MSQYEPSTEAQIIDLKNSSWNGIHQFLDVYACQFPESEKVLKKITVMFNNNAIHYTRIDYPDKFSIFTISSTRPNGETPEEEIAAQQRRVGQLSSDPYVGNFVVEHGVQKTQFPFGMGVFQKLRNVVVNGDADSVFPLNLQFYKVDKTLTMSSHLTFPLGNSRIEIVALVLPPDGMGPREEASMRGTLDLLVDHTMQSMAFLDRKFINPI